MKVLVQANLLAVGMNYESEFLYRLPICLFNTEKAAGAINLLRNEKIDGVFSKWHLDDMWDGLFLRKLKIVKPCLSTIVMVDGSNALDEIQARSLGVTAVVTENCGEEFILATISQVLGIEMPTVITQGVKMNTHIEK